MLQIYLPAGYAQTVSPSRTGSADRMLFPHGERQGMRQHFFLPAREARIACFVTVNMQGDRLASMVDGPTKRAMLVTDMGRGRSIHVPAEWPAQNTPKRCCFYHRPQ